VAKVAVASPNPIICYLDPGKFQGFQPEDIFVSTAAGVYPLAKTKQGGLLTLLTINSECYDWFVTSQQQQITKFQQSYDSLHESKYCWSKQ
jgi:hypothetical protein